MLLMSIYFLFRKFNFFVYVQVGDSSGRKILTDTLQSKEILVGKTKVGKILKEINPNAQKVREYSAGRSLNPKVYKADYFGQKIYYDQNEKLGMYGVFMPVLKMDIQGKLLAIVLWQKK